MMASDLNVEWCLLQNQFDSYEKYSLLIKLTAIVVSVASMLTGDEAWLIVVILLVLWGQDAIWKTFQSRIEVRLIQLEQLIAQGQNDGAYQFNCQFEQGRYSGAALVREYLSQAVRPTVAVPHLALVLILVLDTCFFTGM